MKKIKNLLLMLIVIINALTFTGCWNYREVDQLSIVAGIAVDQGKEQQYEMTVETIEVSGGRETKMTPKILTAEGRTMFDAARNIISIAGKRLYWSHAKVIILSEEIAGEGVSKVLEWYNRDAETREDVLVLISKEQTAKEIFDAESGSENILSFTLSQIMENQTSLGKAPLVDILKYDNESKIKGISTVIPSICLIQEDGKKTPQIMGTAIIKEDKLVGFLDGEETKTLLFVRNEIKGGILVEEFQTEEGQTLISLEVFNNKTKITPVVRDSQITMNITVKAKAAFAEESGSKSFLTEEGIKKLKLHAENTLNAQILSLVEKMQEEYAADVFLFGVQLWEDKPQVYKRAENSWAAAFQDLQVNVTTNIALQNSAELSKSIGAGE